VTLPAAQPPPSSALVVAPTNVLTAQERREFAKSLSGSTFLPQHFRSNEANILYAVELGQSFGLEPVSIMKNIHVFDDGQGRIQAALSADLMVSLARRAGHVVHIKATKMKATATLVRSELLTMDIERLKALSELGLPLKDYFTFEETWTEDDASTAGLLGKGNWKKYPKAMLQARAKAAIVRAAASEVLIQMSDASAQHGGLIIQGERIMPVTTHTADELGDEHHAELESGESAPVRTFKRKSDGVRMNADVPAPAPAPKTETIAAPASTVIPKETNTQIVDYVKEAGIGAIAKLASDVSANEELSKGERFARLISIHAALKFTGRHLEKVEAPEGAVPVAKFIADLAAIVKSQ
jgi:hypothetical protein